MLSFLKLKRHYFWCVLSEFDFLKVKCRNKIKKHLSQTYTEEPLLSRHTICENRDLMSSILHLKIIKALEKPR